MRIFLRIFFLLSFVNVSIASESMNFRLRALVRNGELLKAKKELEKLSKKSELYYRISGQILTKEKNYAQANQLLQKAFEKQAKDQTLFLMAQNALKLKKPNETLSHLKKVKKDTLPLRLMLSQAYWDLGQKNEALALVFKKGFKSNELLEKQKYNFLIKLSRMDELFGLVSKYLEEKPNSVEPVLFAASLLKEKDRFLSEQLFDLSLSKSPMSALLLKEKGAFELERNRPEVASSYFVRASHINKEYSFEASVTKLLLGKHFEALYHARNIPDPVKSLKQRFFIYLDQERFDEVVSLQAQLARLNLFREEKVTYAFLYSAFKVRDLDTFNKVFSSHQLKSQLSKVMRLKNLLEKCENNVELECVFS